jgi:2-polyprenyl-3-methyl-5-hydroxy-6-metoxy-1,4-benzoquinol methylase
MMGQAAPIQGVGKESKIYTQRFSLEQEALREITWKELVTTFFQKYVPAQATVIDIGAGDGLFIKNVAASRRIAIDLSEHVNELSKHGVEVYQNTVAEVKPKLKGAADVVFMSNFLEHLPTKKILLEVLEDSLSLLKPNGRLLILQPNIRYVGVAYWDYVDHHIALTEHSLKEALEVVGYEVCELVPRFLPYTAKSKLGAVASLIDPLWFIQTYLKYPILWKFFGRQTFVVAKRGN